MNIRILIADLEFIIYQMNPMNNNVSPKDEPATTAKVIISTTNGDI